jgi:hypothetical protein
MSRGGIIYTLIVLLVTVANSSANGATAPAAGAEASGGIAGVVPVEELRPQSSDTGIVTPPPTAPAAIALPAPPSTSANPLWAIPLSALTATRERPIFSVSRRPPAPAVAPAAAVRPIAPPPKEPEKPSLALVGTIVGDADGFGIFIDQTDKTALRLKLGEQHNGWILRAVQSREATLEKDQQIVLISMPQPGKGSEIQLSPADPAPPGSTGRDRP